MKEDLVFTSNLTKQSVSECDAYDPVTQVVYDGYVYQTITGLQVNNHADECEDDWYRGVTKVPIHFFFESI